MISRDQENDLKEIYRSLISNDYKRDWKPIDDRLYELDFLSDEEIVKETEIQIYNHSLGEVMCKEEHNGKICLMPTLLRAVDAICESWNETQDLVPKCRYILQNYLAISHLGIIYLTPEESK